MNTADSRITDSRSVDELLDLDADVLTGFEAVDVLLAVHRSCARIEALRLRALEVIERSEVWRAEGAVSFTAWLRSLLGVDHLAASREVRLARASRELPTLAADLAAGSTSRSTWNSWPESGWPINTAPTHCRRWRPFSRRSPVPSRLRC